MLTHVLLWLQDLQNSWSGMQLWDVELNHSDGKHYQAAESQLGILNSHISIESAPCHAHVGLCGHVEMY